jgi:hypothetical protein
MPTNRTPVRRDAKQRITPKALAAYRGVIANDDDEEAKVELFFALGRAPWQYDVLAAADDEAPAYLKEQWRIEDYQKTREIKRELDRLVD